MRGAGHFSIPILDPGSSISTNWELDPGNYFILIETDVGQWRESLQVDAPNGELKRQFIRVLGDNDIEVFKEDTSYDPPSPNTLHQSRQASLPVMLEKTKFLLDDNRRHASVYLIAAYDIDSEKRAAAAHDVARLLNQWHDKLPHFRTSAEVKNEIDSQAYVHTEHLFNSGTPHCIYKMTRREHLVQFLTNGTIGLGPITYYQTAAEQIADPNEGQFVLFGAGDTSSIFCICGLGTNVLAYCTTIDPTIRFDGYDSCLQICDVNAFGKAVTAALDVHLKRSGNRIIRSLWAPCYYQHSRVVMGTIEGSTTQNIKTHLNSLFVDVVGEGKYFMKPSSYAREREYRLIWVLEKSFEAKYLIFECPEAVQYCKPFDGNAAE
jgi:hypothetical protein